MIKRILFILVFSFACTVPTLSAYKYGVGFVNYVPFSGQMQTDTDGSTSMISFNPGITLAGAVHLGSSHYFLPEVGYVFHTGLEDEYSKKTIFVLYDFGYMLAPRWMLRYGPGTFMTRISGEGGTDQVPSSAASGSSTGFRPSESVTSYNTTLNLGIEFAFTPLMFAKFEIFVFGFLDSEKRNLSHGLSFKYLF